MTSDLGARTIRSVRRVGVVSIATAALLAFGMGTANASATKTSGPVTLVAVGSGLTLTNSYTSYGPTGIGPVIQGHLWTDNADTNVYGTWNIGNVCMANTWTVGRANWKATGNTTLRGQWTAGGSLDTAHVPSLSIHS